MLDFHNHLMPGVDDGASDIDESREALQTLRSQGVTEIITTPHIRASLTKRPADLDRFLGVLDESWESLRSVAEAEFPDVRLERGVELMLDVPHPDLTDPRVRLAGTSYALVEFPFMSLPPHSAMPIRELRQDGWFPIIAHPERYAGMGNNYGLVEEWRDAGAHIQVNSGSLLGYYGPAPRRLAWAIVEEGLADYLSSDYHSRGKCAVADCAAVMKARGGADQHQALTETNPQRLLAGEPPVPVPPFKAGDAPFWKRMLPWP